MIDIFNDSLFKAELARLASDKVVTRRVAAHNEFRRLMVKLKEAQEQPVEVRSMTGPYMRMPIREPVKNMYDEVHGHVAEMSRVMALPNLPAHLYTEAKELREFFKKRLSEGPIKLKETARKELPSDIVRWDKNTWLRWHPEKQEYMVMKNPPKPQGRLA